MMASKKTGPESEYVREKLAMVPDSPGIYRYLDKAGQILYIGKAKSLKKRVRSYFSGRNSSYRIGLMVSQIADIEFVVTNSEVEALTLENNLIKEFQPKYNVMLKDGKSYPFVCIKKERFPRVFPTRNRRNDGSQYFGPFTSVTTMNSILSLIRQNYKLRTCNYVLSEENIEAGKFNICLEYQIGNCEGPCEGLISEEEYNHRITQIRSILKGKLGGLLNQLKEEMEAAATEYQFEKAEEIRQKIEKIQQYKRKNTITSESVSDVEVLTIDTLNTLSIINHFKVVDGGIVQAHTYEVRRKEGDSDTDIMKAVFSRLVSEEEEFSKEIISNLEFTNDELLTGYNVTVPQRGDKKKLIDLSLKNCKVLLEEKVWKQNFRKKDPKETILEQLQKDLGLKQMPVHIECFDNSNNQGTYPVASLVVFKNGRPAKDDYRHFKIKTVEGPNDFASMEEVVKRRYKRLLEENSPLPDLVIVDGGKGQLSSAALALKDLQLLDKLPLIGIAKKLEEIYKYGDGIPLHLDKRSTSLKLIQQLRNEAHRFAITFHRNLRSKGGRGTKLTQIEGIGDKTAKKLLTTFKSIKKLKEAEPAQIEEAIGKQKAEFVRKAIEAGEL